MELFLLIARQLTALWRRLLIAVKVICIVWIYQHPNVAALVKENAASIKAYNIRVLFSVLCQLLLANLTDLLKSSGTLHQVASNLLEVLVCFYWFSFISLKYHLTSAAYIVLSSTFAILNGRIQDFRHLEPEIGALALGQGRPRSWIEFKVPYRIAPLNQDLVYDLRPQFCRAWTEFHTAVAKFLYRGTYCKDYRLLQYCNEPGWGSWWPARQISYVYQKTIGNSRRAPAEWTKVLICGPDACQQNFMVADYIRRNALLRLLFWFTPCGLLRSFTSFGADSTVRLALSDETTYPKVPFVLVSNSRQSLVRRVSIDLTCIVPVFLWGIPANIQGSISIVWESAYGSTGSRLLLGVDLRSEKLAAIIDQATNMWLTPTAPMTVQKHCVLLQLPTELITLIIGYALLWSHKPCGPVPLRLASRPLMEDLLADRLHLRGLFPKYVTPASKLKATCRLFGDAVNTLTVRRGYEFYTAGLAVSHLLSLSQARLDTITRVHLHVKHTDRGSSLFDPCLKLARTSSVDHFFAPAKLNQARTLKLVLSLKALTHLTLHWTVIDIQFALNKSGESLAALQVTAAELSRVDIAMHALEWLLASPCRKLQLCVPTHFHGYERFAQQVQTAWVELLST